MARKAKLSIYKQGSKGSIAEELPSDVLGVIFTIEGEHYPHEFEITSEDDHLIVRTRTFSTLIITPSAANAITIKAEEIGGNVFGDER